ncbi:MAG: hypothetical protein GY705_20800 [Bacteroidetes bacterium]|nr:hypothetical protein [Bacteroidota bacterium]
MFSQTCLLLFLFEIFGTIPAFGQEYAYRQYTIHDGLVQMQVQCVFQDSRGYLWIGTKKGLSKFDGEHFENFRKKDGLPNGFIYDIEEDNKGNIWIATISGLTKYDGVHFATFNATFNTNPQIAIDRDDNIWVSDKRKTLWKFDGIEYWDMGQKFPEFKSPLPQDVYFDEEENQLIVTVDDRGCFALKNDSLTKLLNISKGTFHALKKGKLFLSDQRGSGHFITYFYSGGNFEKILERKELEVNFADVEQDYYFDYKGNMYRIKANQQKVLLILELNLPETNLLYIDKDENYWFGTDEGLVQYFGEGFQNFSQEPFRYVWSFIEDDTGLLWFAGYYKGLFQYDGQQVREITNYQSLTDNARKAFYYGARKDIRGDLWFPHSNGILKYHQGNWQLLETSSGTTNTTTFMIEDRDRERFIAAVNRGIFLISLDGKLIFKGKEQGLFTDMYIEGLGQDKNGDYWLGSVDGLSRYEVAKDTFFNYTQSDGNLPVEGINTIYCDFKGGLWFGGTEGLLKYDFLTDSISTIAPDWLTTHLNFITAIDTTYLLLGTFDGLYILNLLEYYESGNIQLTHFNDKNGYMGIEPRTNDAFTDSEGNIWIGSSTISVKLNPRKMKLRTVPLKTYIRTINNEEIVFSKSDATHTIAQGVQDVKIEFEAVGFSRPLTTQYSYRIEVEKGNWSDWQQENYTYLLGLGSGMYSFQVRSRTIGVSSKDLVPATIRFRIDLPFWKEPHFNRNLMLSFGILIGLFLFFLYRNRRIRLKARENEQKVKYLQVQTLQAQMNPHFIFNVLGTLQNLILNSDTRKANEHLINLSVLIRRFLDSSVGSDMPKRASSESEISLEREIELLRMYLDFEKLQYDDTFDYVLELEKGLNVVNITLPPLIIQPYVENAIKHGLRYKDEKGFLKVRFYEENESLLCLIEDDGVGRTEAKKIQKSSIRMYKSLGTKLVEKRLKILNELGHQIETKTLDREGGGTIVKIKIAYQ